MRKLYGPTSWRRVLAFLLVFAMTFSVMGTGGSFAFAEENLPETGEEAVEAPEEETFEVPEEAAIDESPGDEAIPAPAEEAEETVIPEADAEEAAEVPETDEAEAVPADAEKEQEPAAETAAAEEQTEETPEAAVEAAEPEEESSGEEDAVTDAEASVPEGPSEEPADTVVGEFVKGIGAEPAAEESEEAAEPAAEESEEVAEPAAEETEEAAEPAAEESEEVAEPAEETEEAAPAAAEEPAAEPETAEVSEEPEITYPKAKFRDIIGGISVTVKAPAGAFPDGTEMKLAEVEVETIIGAVNDAVDGEIGKIKAVDISFFYKGEEIQPLVPISVTMNASGMDADSERKVLHIDESGSEPVAEVIDTADTSEKAVVFEADSFSVYVVIDFVVPRLTLTFMSGGEAIAEMIIKGSDTADEVDTIIYDPGAGEIPEGQVFKGWTTDSQYTAETKLLTIEDVRKEAMTAVDELVNDEYVTDKYVTYYAAIFKQFTVTYVDDKNITVGTEVVEIPRSKDKADYSIVMEYTTDDSHNLEGWIVADGGNNIDGYPDNAEVETIVGDETTTTAYYYPLGTKITISGDVKFSVNAPEGHWIIFEENGKGATYCAPMFIRSGNVTSEPRPEADMVRNGYTFGGWYDSKANADAHAADPSVTTGKYSFGSTIDETTVVYASWIPLTNAGYTIIFWTQNADRSGYDVKASVYVENGTVGANIPYEFRDNGAEDYVTVNNKDYHYTGFCLKEADANQQIEIKPEGDAVLNLHFDRIEYNLKFYLYRQQGTGANSYSYAEYSAAGNNVWGIATWYANTSLDNMPTTTYTGGIKRDESAIGGYTGYYITLSAYYGEVIKNKWPKYDEIIGPSANRQPVSFIMMNGTALKPDPSSGGDGTIKGEVSVMDENILGATNDANGNFLIVRFNTYNDWIYNIYFEGQAPGDEQTKTFNGKTYYKANEVASRSSNTDPSEQNPPQYQGYETVKNDGRAYYVLNSSCNLDYYYDRQEYKISYFDGVYADGNNNTAVTHSTELLKESTLIGYGMEIPETDRNYKPTKSHEDGYVFEGWFTDEACKEPYTFDKMALGGITVYAKWRLIQYRVFLHPNAGTDSTLTWGSENQAMNFRVNFGEKISVPTGYRNGYEFFGWYTNTGLSEPYASSTVLNETTVKTSYDKTEKTDDMDKWGNIKPDSPKMEGSDSPGYNKDAYTYDANSNTFKAEDRFWITKKLDLYAKWSAITIGADGIGVIYDDAEGSNAPSDTALYKDNTFVSAGAAPKAPAGKVFDRWILQTWTGTEYADTKTEVLAGETFTILKSDAKIVDAETGELIDPADVVKEGKYNYTVQLKAVYKDIEEETPTHIDWYSNYGSDNDGKGTLYESNTGIKINEAVMIYGFENETESWTIPVRAGYKFLGWTKTPGGKEADFLTWIEGIEGEPGYYVSTVDGEEIDAYQVAADERQPYEDLYAVWKPIEANYTVEFYYQSEDGKSYVKEMTDVRSATTEDTVEATADDKAQTKEDKYKLVEGAPSVLSAVVAGDGSTVLKLYFNLKGFNLKIEKAVTSKPENGETYALGEKVTYQITVTNDGELTVSEFVVVDELTGDEIEVESLEPGKTASFDVEYTVTEEDILAGEIVNVATVKTQSPVEPPDTPDTPDVPDIPVTPHDPVIVIPDAPNPHAVITKEATSKPANGEKYAVGERITFAVTVTNDGNVTLTNIAVTDELTGDKWTIESLKPGESETFDTKAYTVVLNDAFETKVRNVATGTGDGPGDFTAEIEEGVKEVDVIPVGRTIKVIFFTNYPSDVEGVEDAYSDLRTVTVPYTVPGFTEVFGESMLAPGYEFTGWEIHSPGEVKAAAEGAAVPASTSSLASASSSSDATDEADFIFYAQWNSIPAPPPDDNPPGPNPPGPNPPRPNPPGPNPPEPEPPIEEPDDEIIDEEPPLANYEEEPDEEIVEEPTPLSPYTGDDRHTVVWSVISLLSLAGIAVLARKRKED